MSSIEFPCSEGRRTDAFLLGSLALAGVVGMLKPPAAAGFMAALVVLIRCWGYSKLISLRAE